MLDGELFERLFRLRLGMERWVICHAAWPASISRVSPTGSAYWVLTGSTYRVLNSFSVLGVNRFSKNSFSLLTGCEQIQLTA